MKRNIFGLFVIVALALSASSCIKETFPAGSTVTDDQIQKSDDPLAVKLGALTASLHRHNAAGYYSLYGTHIDFGMPTVHMLTECMLEDFIYCGSSSWWFTYWLSNKYQGSDYWMCSYYWDAYYSWIFAANNIIASIDDPEKLDASTLVSLGQAYAYRASFYLDLARLYEAKPVKEANYKNYTVPEGVYGLTVPIVTEKTTEKEAMNNKRVPRKEMYDFILSDLEKAEKYIDGYEGSALEPCAAMVDGLLARTWLELGYVSDTEFDNDAFKKAQDYAEKAIAKSGKTPLTQNEWEDSANGFNSASSQNSWIWGIPVVSESVGNLTSFNAWISSEATWCYGYYAQFGAGKSLYDSISDSDFRKHSFIDPKKSEYYDYKLAGSSDQIAAFYKRIKSYANIKFRAKYGEIDNYVTGGVGDYPMMRVEEMYFIKMEALARQHNLTAANEALTDFMSHRITDGSYESSAATEKAFLKEMLLQKRAEFWGEGVLIFDYKRLNQGITRGYTGTNFPATMRFNTSGRSPEWNIVITRGEFQANTGITPELNNPDPSQVIPLWE